MAGLYYIRKEVTVIGAIVGDIIGSRFEGAKSNPKRKKFSLYHKHTRFTDDTVLTVATCDAILFDRNYRDVYREYYARYPKVGYGGSFRKWAVSKTKDPYNSWGNGSAMRVSPIGWAFNTETTVLEEAEKSAAVTHNHPEGVKGAQAVALAVFMARTGDTKEAIRKRIEEEFEYDLNPPITGKFEVSCQGSVPHAIAAFLDSEGFEDTIRKAIFRGGDSDTIAAIAGSIAEPYYGIPKRILEEAFDKIPEDLANITELFVKAYKDDQFVKPEKKEHEWKKLFNMLTSKDLL